MLHALGVYFRQWSVFDYTQTSHLLYFGLFQLNFVIYFTCVIIIYQGLVLTGVLGLVVALISAIKLKQVEEYVKETISAISTSSTRKSSLSPVSISSFLNRFLTQNDISLRWLSDVNRIYGVAILGYMLINMPLNAILMMMLLMGKLKRSLIMVVVILAATQMLIIFVINLFCAILSRQLHRPAKCILRLSIRESEGRLRWLSRVRLKMAFYIERFHTKNEFTVTFGKVAKINFPNFGRVDINF